MPIAESAPRSDYLTEFQQFTERHRAANPAAADTLPVFVAAAAMAANAATESSEASFASSESSSLAESTASAASGASSMVVEAVESTAASATASDSSGGVDGYALSPIFSWLNIVCTVCSMGYVCGS